MSIIKGQNLRLKIGGDYVAFSTSCKVHVSVSLEESSTKDSTGDWTEQEVTGKSWDISCDALYSVEPDTGASNGSDLLDTLLAGEKVEVELVQTNGEKNRAEIPDGAKLSGHAIVNDITINADNKQNASYSIQLTGVGELAKS
jgi:predicted secreted protein